MEKNYYVLYQKYKNKYLNLKNNLEGGFPRANPKTKNLQEKKGFNKLIRKLFLLILDEDLVRSCIGIENHEILRDEFKRVLSNFKVYQNSQTGTAGFKSTRPGASLNETDRHYSYSQNASVSNLTPTQRRFYQGDDLNYHYTDTNIQVRINVGNNSTLRPLRIAGLEYLIRKIYMDRIVNTDNSIENICIAIIEILAAYVCETDINLDDIQGQFVNSLKQIPENDRLEQGSQIYDNISNLALIQDASHPNDIRRSSDFSTISNQVRSSISTSNTIPNQGMSSTSTSNLIEPFTENKIVPFINIVRNKKNSRTGLNKHFNQSIYYNLVIYIVCLWSESERNKNP